MFCPIKYLSTKDYSNDKCVSGCAWVINEGHGEYACAVAMLASRGLPSGPTLPTKRYNTQKLEGPYELA